MNEGLSHLFFSWSLYAVFFFLFEPLIRPRPVLFIHQHLIAAMLVICVSAKGPNISNLETKGTRSKVQRV